jgi:hypothetical protein
MLMSDGLNKALQMHNSSSIVDHFPRRMEKVCDIIPTSTSFAVFQALFLNPGNTVLLPIFSKIAAVYEQYRWRFLRFHYVSEAYTASGSNISAGKVIMGTNFDPDDAQFTSATQMENYTGSDRGAPFTNFCHDVLKSLKANRTNPLREYFVNASANQGTPGVSTDKFYDMGLFQFATAGLPSDSAIEYGELYVEFEVDMIRPKQPDASGSSSVLYAHITEGAATSATGAHPLGTTGGVLSADSTLNSVSTTTTFTLPVAGKWLVSASWITTASDVGAPVAFAGGANITGLDLIYDDAMSFIQIQTNAGACAQYVCSVTASGTGAANTITVSGLTSLTVGTCDIFIAQLPTTVDLVARKRGDVATLKGQVAELGRMMKALLLKIPDNDGHIIMCEEKDDCEVVERLRASGPASSGVRKATSSITDPGYKAPPASNNVTPLSGKQGLSKLFF